MSESLISMPRVDGRLCCGPVGILDKARGDVALPLHQEHARTR